MNCLFYLNFILICINISYIYFYFIWAIHTTLYRICCIEYTWLFVNIKFYAVLCISHSKCIFLALKQFDSTKPTLISKKHMKTYTHFFHSHNNDSMKPIQLLKIYWAIHTTLYRVCCIEYFWLLVNAQFYAVLCMSYFKCIFLIFKPK